MPEKLLQYREIVSCVQIQKAQLTDEFQRSVPHTAEEIDKVGIVVVVHLKFVGDRLAEEDSSRTAEGFDIPSVIRETANRECAGWMSCSHATLQGI